MTLTLALLLVSGGLLYKFIFMKVAKIPQDLDIEIVDSFDSLRSSEAIQWFSEVEKQLESMGFQPIMKMVTGKKEGRVTSASQTYGNQAQNCYADHTLIPIKRGGNIVWVSGLAFEQLNIDKTFSMLSNSPCIDSSSALPGQIQILPPSVKAEEMFRLFSSSRGSFPKLAAAFTSEPILLLEAAKVSYSKIVERRVSVGELKPSKDGSGYVLSTVQVLVRTFSFQPVSTGLRYFRNQRTLRKLRAL